MNTTKFGAILGCELSWDSPSILIKDRNRHTSDFHVALRQLPEGTRSIGVAVHVVIDNAMTDCPTFSEESLTSRCDALKE